jgi:hypothetical protein
MDVEWWIIIVMPAVGVVKPNIQTQNTIIGGMNILVVQGTNPVLVETFMIAVAIITLAPVRKLKPNIAIVLMFVTNVDIALGHSVQTIATIKITSYAWELVDVVAVHILAIIIPTATEHRLPQTQPQQFIVAGELLPKWQRVFQWFCLGIIQTQMEINQMVMKFG